MGMPPFPLRLLEVRSAVGYAVAFVFAANGLEDQVDPLGQSAFVIVALKVRFDVTLGNVESGQRLAGRLPDRSRPGCTSFRSSMKTKRTAPFLAVFLPTPHACATRRV